MELLVGVLAILIGLLSCFAGYRIFVLLLPVWGFVVGFLLGANAVVEIFGTGFLQDVVGIVVGIIGGAVVAAIAYIWWWLAVVVAIAGPAPRLRVVSVIVNAMPRTTVVGAVNAEIVRSGPTFIDVLVRLLLVSDTSNTAPPSSAFAIT